MSKNKQSGIMGALTRKIGPLPAWAWAILAGIGVWYYRNKLSAASSTSTSTTTPTDTSASQSPVVLQPGESVYDPNTGALDTASGGGGSSGDTTSTDGANLDAAMNNLAQALGQGITVQTIQPGMVPGSSGGTSGSGGSGGGNSPRSGTRMSTVTKAQSKAGDISAPFGAKKPTAAVPAGYRVVGTGKGNWVYKPKPPASRNSVKTTRNNSKGKKK